VDKTPPRPRCRNPSPLTQWAHCNTHETGLSASRGSLPSRCVEQTSCRLGRCATHSSGPRAAPSPPPIPRTQSRMQKWADTAVHVHKRRRTRTYEEARRETCEEASLPFQSHRDPRMQRRQADRRTEAECRSLSLPLSLSLLSLSSLSLSPLSLSLSLSHTHTHPLFDLLQSPEPLGRACRGRMPRRMQLHAMPTRALDRAGHGQTR
jgi:hypothetical protein